MYKISQKIFLHIIIIYIVMCKEEDDMLLYHHKIKLKNLIYRFTQYSKRSIDKIDINKMESDKLLNEGAILVDVRSPQEYKEGHLEGAILIPEYELLYKHKIKFKDKDEIIILYCSNGLRSKKAQKKLKKLGYKNVYNLLLPDKDF